MTLFARIFRLVWGGDVDRALRPVLAVSLTGSIAGSALFPFLGIWAIKELHASQSAARVRLSSSGAVLSGVVGYLGGHIVRPRRAPADDPDRLGLPGARAARAARSSAHNVLAGLTLLALLPAFGSLGGAADQAMVADLVAPERQEAAYAVGARRRRTSASRSARRSAACFLIGGNWHHLCLGVSPARRCSLRDRVALHPARRRVRARRAAAARVVRA